MPLDRELIKQKYPNIYKYVLGGERADEYTKKNVQAVTKVKTTVVAGFDIVSWIKENWQLTIIGFIALLVLLRD